MCKTWFCVIIKQWHFPIWRCCLSVFVIICVSYCSFFMSLHCSYSQMILTYFSFFGLILMLASGFLSAFTSLYILCEWVSEGKKIQYWAKQQDVWKVEKWMWAFRATATTQIRQKLNVLSSYVKNHKSVQTIVVVLEYSLLSSMHHGNSNSPALLRML